MRRALWIGLLQVSLGFCMVMVGASMMNLRDISPAILTQFPGITILIIGVIIMYGGIMIMTSELCPYGREFEDKR